MLGPQGRVGTERRLERRGEAAVPVERAPLLPQRPAFERHGAELLVEARDLLDRHPARQPGRDDRTRAGAADQVKELAQAVLRVVAPLAQLPLELGQDTERDHPTDAAPVEGEDPARARDAVALRERAPRRPVISHVASLP
jgi:hypothetical protein